MLPTTGNDADLSLVTDGAISGSQTLAYFYQGAWYRSTDNSLIDQTAYVPTDALWHYTSTFGNDTATWSENTGNITIVGGGSQTANVFYSTPVFETGDTASVDITGNIDNYFTISTTNRGPNTGSESGLRFHWQFTGNFRARAYNNGVNSDTNFPNTNNVSTGPVTLHITRVTDTSFNVAYDSGSGVVTLNTNPITIAGVGSDPLYIGVESWNTGTRTFSNIRTTNIGKLGVIGSFSVGAVADPQYYSGLTGGTTRLSDAVTAFNSRNIDWGVMLGDIIDRDNVTTDSTFTDPDRTTSPTVTGATRWTNADAILGAWNNLNVPDRLLLGNHDYYVPDEDTDGTAKPANVYRKFGFDDNRGYYDFLYEGFRFVVLEGDNSFLNYKTGTTEHTKAVDYYNDFSGTQKQYYNAGVSITQRKWMLDVLDGAYIREEPTVILCHYPIHTPVGNHTLLNSAELVDIVDGYSNIMLWMHGHDHDGDYSLMGTRHHLGLKGMKVGSSNWYQIDFEPTNVKVYKASDTTTAERQLDITRPVFSIDSPTGVTLTNGTLSWDTEPSGATQVIIERRHITSLVYELPSAAQTLSWQNASAINVSSSTQTYTDSPTNPISQYKYRIRFSDGSGGYSKYIAP